jgi:4-amino-4-deoxy-L-arabinose transferase-like glycosyltransferase
MVEPLDHGYPRYAAIADDMVRTGDWIVPRLDGRIYVQKPPLFIWLVAIPIAIAGRVPEWAGHLPNIIACAGILFGAYLFSRRIFTDRQKALLSVLILATSYEFSFQVREERLDMVFIAFLLGAFLCFYQAVTATSPALGRTARIIACYLFVALATLTKGPVGLLFFLAVVIPFVLWTGRVRFFIEKESLLGYVIFLALSSVWPLLLITRIGLKEALSAFQSTDMITRREGPFFYFVELPIIFSPWIIFLPAVVIWLVREKPYRGSEGIRFLLCWFGAFFALLHLSSGKSTRYILPVMIPLAILTAGAVYGTMTAAAQLPLRWIRRLRDGTVWLLLVSILGASFASPLLFSIAPEDKLFVIAGGLMAGIGSLIAIRQFFKYRDPVKCLLFAGMLILFLYAIFDAVHARRFIRNDTRVLAEQALEPITAGAPARTYGLKNTQRQFLVSMLTRRSVPFVSTLPELKEWVRKEAGGEVFVVADSKKVNELITDPALSAESYAAFCLEKHDMQVVRVAAGKRSVGMKNE